MQKQKSTPPWRSKLTPFQDEILTAWYQERATLKTIQSRLTKYGITITLSGISRFIRCRRNSTDPHQPPPPSKSAAPPQRSARRTHGKICRSTGNRMAG